MIYTEAFDSAQMAISHRKQMGFHHSPSAARSAALAAVRLPLVSRRKLGTIMAVTLEALEWPKISKWDGSIG